MGPKRKVTRANAQREDNETTPQPSTSSNNRSNVVQSKASNFSININPYFGDPQLLDHFFQQVTELTEINS